MRQLEFPVLLYTDAYMLGGLGTEKELCTFGEEKFNEGCLDGARIIDSSMNAYTVKGATRRRVAFRPSSLFGRYRTILVDMKLSGPEPLSLGEFKRRIVGILDERKWPRKNAAYARELKTAVDKAESATQVIKAISVLP